MNTRSEFEFGTTWNNLRADGQEFILSHLRPFDLVVRLEDGEVLVRVAFGHHVFTDEKQNGPAFKYDRETRYLSSERIARSVALPDLLRTRFAEEHSRACRSQSGAKQFFMLQEADWAIFYDLRLRGAKERLFTMRVITAYTVDESARLSIPGPTHKLYRNAVILNRLLNGMDLNHDRQSH